MWVSASRARISFHCSSFRVFNLFSSSFFDSPFLFVIGIYLRDTNSFISSTAFCAWRWPGRGCSCSSCRGGVWGVSGCLYCSFHLYIVTLIFAPANAITLVSKNRSVRWRQFSSPKHRRPRSLAASITSLFVVSFWMCFKCSL